MEEDFLATLKLMTGEEIVVSKVCYLEDEDKVLLENPLQVESAKQRKGQLEVSGFSFKEWISATFDNMFIIKRDHIMTMTEVDGQIQEFYEKTIQRLEKRKESYQQSKQVAPPVWVLRFCKSNEEISRRYL